jgi:hypothetical protein
VAAIVVVSGLPRSGTSLAMQMLRAGGYPVLEDSARLPDDDNPRGYVEYEKTLRLWQDASWLHEAAGRAVKIVCPLLAALPFDHDYAVILMQRDLAEVAASQATMLRRRGEDASRLGAFAELVQALERFQRWVRYQPNFRCLELGYRDALADPAATAARIEAFLGVPLDRAAMTSAIDPGLHRQRARAASV